LALQKLTQEEVFEVVNTYYLKKVAKENEFAYWDKVYKERSYPKHTAEKLFENIVSVATTEIPGFAISVYDKEPYELLALYFTNDLRFEERGYSLKKGLFLFGNVGCGKSTAMNLFRRNQHQSFVINPSKDISAEFTLSGQEAIERYYKLLKPSNRDMYFGQEYLGRCFDDIGVEGIASNYGTKINVISDLILSIYNRDQHSHDFCTTHFTSNCDISDLEKLYGSRVTSRIAEMCNVIEFPTDAPDKRMFSTKK
jgi:hypothetical protein